VIVTGGSDGCPANAVVAAGVASAIGVRGDAVFAVEAAAGFGAVFAAGFDAATDIADGAVEARRGAAPLAPSPSVSACRAVISAAAASTHVIPTTIARQLYAFGGGGIGDSGGREPVAVFAATVVFAAAAGRAFVFFR
jgi:hypothetical protein